MSQTETKWEDTVEWVGIIAGCVIRQDGKYLLVQEKQAKVHGLWNLPAGYVDKGETITQAAIREAKEETGFAVKLGSELGVYHEASGRPVKHAFEAQISGGDLKIQTDEILDAKWFTFVEIDQLHGEQKLRADWVWEAVVAAETGER